MTVVSGGGLRRLLEREVELARVGREFDRLGDGVGSVVVVEGPAGIGKSELLAAVRERALARGLGVLRARSSEFEQEIAFGVARQLFEPILRTASAAQRRRLLDGVARVGARALGVEAGVTGTTKTQKGARFLATGEGAVWILNQSDGSVSKLDPGSGNVVATIPAKVPGDGGCIATGLGSVWVTMPQTPVLRIDPKSNKVIERWTGAGGDCIGAGFGSVWLSNHDVGNLWRIKP